MGAKRLLEFVAASGGAVFLGALGTMMKFLLMLFVLFFMLRDGPRIAQTLVRMLPIETHLRGKLWRHLIDVTRAVFMGIGLTALAQGTLLGIGFAIAGLPSPLLFGVLGRTVRAGADRRHHHRVGTRDPLAAVAGPAPLRNLHASRGAWWWSAPWTTSCGQS